VKQSEAYADTHNHRSEGEEFAVCNNEIEIRDFFNGENILTTIIQIVQKVYKNLEYPNKFKHTPGFAYQSEKTVPNKCNLL